MSTSISLPVQRVVDLTDPANNYFFNCTAASARAVVQRGNAAEVAQLEGQFALVTVDGQTVRLARSLNRPLRYFIAKQADGPVLVASDRIDRIYQWLSDHDLADQFHPSYTRMVPAHHLVELFLVGCPDPNPNYLRFFAPARNELPTDLQEIGRRYLSALQAEIFKWLQILPKSAPIGVCFSGGIDSGSVLLLTYHTLLKTGQSPARLKAFTLSTAADGQDLAQARQFLQQLDLEFFLEPITVPASALNVDLAIQILEDYKPLDVQCAAMTLALCRGIRERYPYWRYLLDGDGGDENLKSYPIEDNPELTIRSVLNNLLLYHEGWGVNSIKHSLTYSGGLSRGYTRTYAPLQHFGFRGFSPYTSAAVVALAEAIPFIDLTQWHPDRLYQLKGEIVRAGVQAVTGLEMPIFPKRRFQHGVTPTNQRPAICDVPQRELRRRFLARYE